MGILQARKLGAVATPSLLQGISPNQGSNLHLLHYQAGFPGGSADKESSCKVGDLGSIPGLGRSLGEGNGYSLQYSGLENSMDCIVLGVAMSQT